MATKIKKCPKCGKPSKLHNKEKYVEHEAIKQDGVILVKKCYLVV